MHWITDVQVWLALVTLTAMEVVLGIDNIIFISILTGKLPQHRQAQGSRHRSRLCDDHPNPAAALDHLDHEAHRAALHRCGTRVLGTRPDTLRGWPLPSGEERS